MRRILLAFLCLFFINTFVNAQIWLEAGPKATFGPSGYLNSTLSSDDKHDYSLSLAFNYGLTAGLNIGDNHGLNFEALWGSYYQNFTFRPTVDTTTRNVLEWEVLDLYALYRFYANSGVYVEAGPKFTRVNEISQRVGVTPVDIQGQYEENYISGVLGVGAFLAGSEVMVIKSNLRFEYGLTDFVTAEGIANGFPSNNSGLSDPGDTVPFRVSFGLEVSFGIGGIAQSACGRRGFVLGTRY